MHQETPPIDSSPIHQPDLEDVYQSFLRSHDQKNGFSVTVDLLITELKFLLNIV